MNFSARRFELLICFLFVVLIGFCSRLNAQQAIFNVPTTDVLDEGKVYLELDAAFKPNNQEAVSRFSAFTPRAVFGVGRNIEIGLNVTGNIQPGADATTLVPNVKWRFYQNKKKDVSLIAGSGVFIPVRNRAYNIGSYSYIAGSRTFNEKTRLTAGAFYFSKNVVAPKASRAGGQFGFEHFLNQKVTLAADWFTGRHGSGYFTPGVMYKPHPKVTTYFSYQIGNSDARRGNHFFLFEIGYNPN